MQAIGRSHLGSSSIPNPVVLFLQNRKIWKPHLGNKGMQMIFVFGFFCGLILGAVIVHLIHEYFDAMLPLESKEDQANWLNRTCPPCDGKCQQGRYCPERK